MSLASGLIPLVGTSAQAANERPKTAPNVETEHFDAEFEALIDPSPSAKSTTKKKKKKPASTTSKKSKQTKLRSQSSATDDDVDLDDMTPKVGIEIKPATLALPELNFEDSFEFLSSRAPRSSHKPSFDSQPDGGSFDADSTTPSTPAQPKKEVSTTPAVPKAKLEFESNSHEQTSLSLSGRAFVDTPPLSSPKFQSRKPTFHVDTGSAEDEFGDANIEELLPTGNAPTSPTTTPAPGLGKLKPTTPLPEPAASNSSQPASSIQAPPETQDGDDYLPSFLTSGNRPRSRRARTARASTGRSFSFDQNSVTSEPTPRAVQDPFAFLESPTRSTITATDRREYFSTSRTAGEGDDLAEPGAINFAKTAPAGSLTTIDEHSTDAATTASLSQQPTKPIVGAFITSNDDLQSPVREKVPSTAQVQQHRPQTAPSSAAVFLTTAHNLANASAPNTSPPKSILKTRSASLDDDSKVGVDVSTTRHQHEPAPTWLPSQTATTPTRTTFDLSPQLVSPSTSQALHEQTPHAARVTSPPRQANAQLSAALGENRILGEQLAQLRETCDKLLREKAEAMQAQEREQLKFKLEQETALAKQHHLHEQGMLALQEQHKAVVEALKRVHEDEMSAFKSHTQDAQVLDSLAHQIKMSAGSLKLLETQVSAGYRGLDATREGQLEARERLLRDMEASAKGMQKQAESEGYKLNGYLQSMEHLLRSLRSQHVEERERLRLEHLRLEDLQQAIRAESEESRRQLEEEKFALQEKAKALASEKRDWLVERDLWRREFQAKEAALDRLKEELARSSAQTNKVLEETKRGQEEEQLKLDRQRRLLTEDLTAFEQAKAAAAHQLEIAEKVEAELAFKESELLKERVRLSKFAEDVHALSNQVAERSELAEQQIVSARQAKELAQQQLAQLRAREEQVRVADQALQSLARKLDNDRLSIVQQQTEALRARGVQTFLHPNSARDTTRLSSAFQPSTPTHRGFDFITQFELPVPPRRHSTPTTPAASYLEQPLHSKRTSVPSQPPSIEVAPLRDDKLKQATAYLQTAKLDLQRLQRERKTAHSVIDFDPSHVFARQGRE